MGGDEHNDIESRTGGAVDREPITFNHNLAHGRFDVWNQ